MTSRTPGGNTAARYPIIETMFGSFNVHAIPTMSPIAAALIAQKRAKSSGESGDSQPPLSESHLGLVKWWKVTIGRIPRSRHPAMTRL